MRVALAQMNSGTDVAENVENAALMLAEAAEAGADLACLPEMFPFMGSSRHHHEVAEPVPGPTSERLAAVARARGMWVLGGSLFEADGDRVYNTSLLFDRTGEIVARYRKIHLFDVELPGQPPMRESASFSAGDEIVTAGTEFGRVGLTVCYDLRFPELYRALMARGAEIVFVPSAFTYETGVDHWEVLLRARAIENQTFVLAPAQWGEWGPEEHHRRCYGHSMVVDPWGTIVAEAAEDEWQVVVTDIDLGEVRRVRDRLPALRHRRLGLGC